jgi:hypothetical protein
MTDYVSGLLEIDAAKRNLTELFKPENLRTIDPRSIAIVARDQNRVVRTSAKQNSEALRDYCCTPTPISDRTGAAPSTVEPDQNKRDLTASSFVLGLALVGAVLAAHTDRPVFWLCLGPAPLIFLHTLGAFLRQRMIRREGLLVFCKKER